jgi:hypothetical protein
MADKNAIAWQELHELGYTIVDANYFGKKGVRLIPVIKFPKDLKEVVKEDITFRLEVVEPKSRQGEVIETIEQLKTL